MPIVEPPRPLPGARLLFTLDPAVAHLDHAAFGAVPAPVQRAHQRLREEMESSPVRFHGPGLNDRLRHVRDHVAGFLGADPATSLFVRDIQAGIEIALSAVGLGQGGQVVTTDHGRSSVARAVARFCARHRLDHATVPVPLGTADQVLAALRQALSGRVRILVVDQVGARTGHLFPVAELVKTAHRAGVAVVVDGLDGPGQVPTDVAGMGADFWVGGLHSWAFAPRPTVFLSASDRWWPQVRKMADGSVDNDPSPPTIDDPGLVDCTGWLAAPTGLYVLRSLGVDAVRDHNIRLADYGQECVAAQVGGRGLRPPVVGPPSVGPPSVRRSGESAVRIVPLPTGVADTPEQAAHLQRSVADRMAAEVSVTSWRGRGVLRISAQVYNRAEEYQRLASQVGHLVTTGMV